LLQTPFGRPFQAENHIVTHVQALRAKIDCIVVIYQENRTFDHYFGAYQPPSGGAVDGLLDANGHIALLLPGRGLRGQLFDTVDAAIKSLGRQHAISISTMFNQLACFP
jgi:Phosphoesterase family